MSRVLADATAYPQRRSHFIMNVHTRWRAAAEDETCIAWARALFDAVAPYAAGSVYVNFMSADEPERIAGGVYAGNYARLAQVKRRYDPGNLFRMNHNIAPAGSG